MDTSHNASTKSTTSRSKVRSHPTSQQPHLLSLICVILFPPILQSKTATDHISGHVSDLKLELLYNRLLQASYLDVKVSQTPGSLMESSLNLFLSVCLPACLSVHLSACLSVCLSACLSVCLCLCLSV